MSIFQTVVTSQPTDAHQIWIWFFLLYVFATSQFDNTIIDTTTTILKKWKGKNGWHYGESNILHIHIHKRHKNPKHHIALSFFSCSLYSCFVVWIAFVLFLHRQFYLGWWFFFFNFQCNESANQFMQIKIGPSQFDKIFISILFSLFITQLKTIPIFSVKTKERNMTFSK